MQILSDYTKDTRSPKAEPGAYEWWYFDGIDLNREYSFTIIFYEGNPFSTRCIKHLGNQDHSDNIRPEDYPAVSISIYKNQRPIYYSFTEFDKKNCVFDLESPNLKIGNHTLTLAIADNILTYQLILQEELPSGDAINGRITFESPKISNSLFYEKQKANHEPHIWNLVQPRAEVTAEFTISARMESARQISFKGTGYHDHNLGKEPMRDEFNEWYWGRFHFRIGTLIYYILDRKDEQQQRAWLLSPDGSRLLAIFTDIELQDKGWSTFGINSARKIMLRNEKTHITVQQAGFLDNGPFYQRFSSDAFIYIPGEDVIQMASGITEYIRPDRIYWRIFWPLINMRIRYAGGEPHWVQHSKRLYRWTW